MAVRLYEYGNSKRYFLCRTVGSAAVRMRCNLLLSSYYILYYFIMSNPGTHPCYLYHLILYSPDPPLSFFLFRTGTPLPVVLTYIYVCVCVYSYQVRLTWNTRRRERKYLFPLDTIFFKEITV